MNPARRVRPQEGDLPTLPPVAAQLIALFSRQNYTLDEIVHTLEHDPPVSGRVLRLANSAYYGFSSRVETLRRAVVMLGAATVQGLALAAAVLHHWAGRGVPPEVLDLWAHGYLCGKGARHLAVRMPNRGRGLAPDALFLVGLFHDVGKIRFLARDLDGYAALLTDCATQEELRVREAETYGRDHAEAGADLLEAWDLPDPLVTLVRHHHGGRLRAELQTDLDIVRAADGVLRGRPPPDTISEALVRDLAERQENDRIEAEAFCNAIT